MSRPSSARLPQLVLSSISDAIVADGTEEGVCRPAHCTIVIRRALSCLMKEPSPPTRICARVAAERSRPMQDNLLHRRESSHNGRHVKPGSAVGAPPEGSIGLFPCREAIAAPRLPTRRLRSHAATTKIADVIAQHERKSDCRRSHVEPFCGVQERCGNRSTLHGEAQRLLLIWTTVT